MSHLVIDVKDENSYLYQESLSEARYCKHVSTTVTLNQPNLIDGKLILLTGKQEPLLMILDNPLNLRASDLNRRSLLEKPVSFIRKMSDQDWEWIEKSQSNQVLYIGESKEPTKLAFSPATLTEYEKELFPVSKQVGK